MLARYIMDIIYSASAVLSFIMLIVLLIKGRRTPVVFSYLWCISLVFFWSTGYLMEYMAYNRGLLIISLRIQYIAICFIGFSWFLFSSYYTSYWIIKKRKLLILMGIGQLIFYILILNNYTWQVFYSRYELADNGLIVSKLNFMFWVNALANYIYIMWAISILVKYIKRKSGMAQKQAIMLLAAIVLPIVANGYLLFAYVSSNNFLHLKIDLTPISFTVTLMFFMLAIYKYRFMNIISFATKKVFANLKDSIVVVDNFNRISGFNQAFKEQFISELDLKTNDSLHAFTKALKTRFVENEGLKNIMKSMKNNLVSEFIGEIYCLSEEKTLEVIISPIIYKNKDTLGKIIIFHDISLYKNLFREVENKNGELKRLNTQLINYSEKIEELTLVKERNRLARDIHDTLGHSMALMIRILEVAKINLASDVPKAQENLKRATEIARDGLSELRKSIKGLSYDQITSANMQEAINKMITTYEKSGIKIDLDLIDENGHIPDPIVKIIYRTIQEALTNSVKHGRATTINIILKFTELNIQLFIIDNGQGASPIVESVGLSSMRERIESIDGKITYGSDVESGFFIRVQIPKNWRG